MDDITPGTSDEQSSSAVQRPNDLEGPKAVGSLTEGDTAGQRKDAQSHRHHRRFHGRRNRRPQDRTPDSTSGKEQTPQQLSAAPEQAAKGGPGRLPAPQGQRVPEAKQPPQRLMDISVVIPLYNEEESLRELHQQLRPTLNRMNVRYELLFIDDGSTDNSFRVLRDLKRIDHHVKIIRFRRNYGKSAALSVGFAHAQGNIVVTMDADLQDDPAEIPGLVKRIREGADLVSGWKKVRRDPITKTVPSRFFNVVTSLMTGIRIHDFNCGLKAYKKEVVKTVKVYGELHRFIPVLAHWEGFSVGEMVVQHRARKYGRTKFGLGRFWKGFLDLITALFTTRYFRRPLHLFGVWGILAVVAGSVIDSWLIVEWFLGATALSNRPLFLVGVVLVIVGIQFISIGLLGEMISKTKQAEEHYAIRDIVK
jgi:glycosyltransferase involved in cell wall biosynthesis